MSNIDKTEDIQAFPCSNTYSYYGMSLRDYFAGQVICGKDGRVDHIAEHAYAVADAMLKERDK